MKFVVKMIQSLSLGLADNLFIYYRFECGIFIHVYICIFQHKNVFFFSLEVCQFECLQQARLCFCPRVQGTAVFGPPGIYNLPGISQSMHLVLIHHFIIMVPRLPQNIIFLLNPGNLFGKPLWNYFQLFSIPFFKFGMFNCYFRIHLNLFEISKIRSSCRKNTRNPKKRIVFATLWYIVVTVQHSFSHRSHQLTASNSPRNSIQQSSCWFVNLTLCQKFSQKALEVTQR